MTMQHRVFRAQIKAVADDEVQAILSTNIVARDQHILEPRGCDLTEYLLSPVVLWSHDAEQVVGRCENIRVEPNKIVATIRFAPLGTSAKCDEVRQLVKNGFVTSLSVGFEALDMTPLDPRKPHAGQRITKWTLLEASFVSVPADPLAVVTARAHRQAGEETMTKSKHKQLLDRAHASAHQAIVHAQAARGAVREILSAEELDEDSAYIQTSEGTHVDEGSRSVEFRRRQAEKLRLSAPELTSPTPTAPSYAERQREKRALMRGGH